MKIYTNTVPIHIHVQIIYRARIDNTCIKCLGLKLDTLFSLFTSMHPMLQVWGQFYSTDLNVSRVDVRFLYTVVQEENSGYSKLFII